MYLFLYWIIALIASIYLYRTDFLKYLEFKICLGILLLYIICIPLNLIAYWFNLIPEKFKKITYKHRRKLELKQAENLVQRYPGEWKIKFNNLYLTNTILILFDEWDNQKFSVNITPLIAEVIEYQNPHKLIFKKLEEETWKEIIVDEQNFSLEIKDSKITPDRFHTRAILAWKQRGSIQYYSRHFTYPHPNDRSIRSKLEKNLSLNVNPSLTNIILNFIYNKQQNISNV